MPQTFTYTAKRNACYSLVGTFAGLLLLEGGGWTLLIALFALPVWLKVVLIATDIAVFLALIFGVMLSPLWTKHRVTEPQLLLQYGFDRLAIPRSWLVVARPVTERLSFIYAVHMRFDGRQKKLLVVFSDQGQVLLSLDQAHMVHVRGKDVEIESILVNVDRREAFLAALHLSDEPSSSLPEPIEKLVPEHLLLSSVQEALVPPRTDVAIEVRHLSRRFDRVEAVSDLNLCIRAGEIYGFLGPNGAGKTTTIKMLVGLVAPTAGSVQLAGHDLHTEAAAAKAALGYVPDRAILYEQLTGREFLRFLAQLRGIPQDEAYQRIDRLLELLDLNGIADVLSGTYSFGTKRKLTLAGALLHEPSVLILDEPLNGLDPGSARRLKALLIKLASQGTTIFLSTHDLTTVEHMCHRVGIIFHGKLIAEGDTSELRSRSKDGSLEEVFLQLTEVSQERKGIS